MSAELGCFSEFFFPAGLDPIKSLKGAEFLRSQADSKLAEKGPFSHIPFSQLLPHTHSQAEWQGSWEAQAAGKLWLYYFLNLPLLQGN